MTRKFIIHSLENIKIALYNKPIQDEILKSYTKDQIMKIYDDKIKELSENGFYNYIAEKTQSSLVAAMNRQNNF